MRGGVVVGGVIIGLVPQVQAANTDTEIMNTTEETLASTPSS